MSDKLKAIIIDDEPNAIRGISQYLNDIKYIELVATCENAMDAYEILSNQSIDLMFLDIEMPKITGLQFLKTLKHKPITIITSAFQEYAIESFELDVIDYLVKPFAFERFVKAVGKAKDYHELITNKTHNTERVDDHIFIKCEKKIEKVFFEDIVYVEGLKNYIAIYTTNKRLITYLTLKSIEEKLPEEKFLKVQKSFIVAKEKVVGIQENELIVAGRRITIARAIKDEIIKTVLGNNYLKRGH